jgi:phosphoglucomutase
VKVIDYLQSGKTGLPSSDVIQFFTSEGDIISVRSSGTEPKIRFYYSVNGPDASKKTELLKKEFLS